MTLEEFLNRLERKLTLLVIVWTVGGTCLFLTTVVMVIWALWPTK